MRLWHEDLIKRLPRGQLLGQHRECCALRGNGWGKKHATVNYVFKYSPYLLFSYHKLVMNEMERRGYSVTEKWKNKDYRGKSCSSYNNLEEVPIKYPVYPEHDNEYYKECIDNLREKEIYIE